MRLLQSVTAALLLPLAALAAKETGDQKWANYRANQLSKSGPIKLSDSTYSKLTGAPRNYTSAILLTALDARFGCQLCHEFDPEWDLLTRSWVKGDKAGESRVVFATLDFLDGKGTFQSLGLQTAPILLVFPPTEGPHAQPASTMKRLDFTGVNRAEGVHNWLTSQVPSRPHPPLVRPTNWAKVIGTAVAVLGGISAVAVMGPHLLPIVQNRNLWAAGSLIAILLFTSGHMFNHIRGVPYVAGNGKGQVSYFAGGFQNQYGLETQIIAALYGLLAFATISLALKVPRINDPAGQKLAIFVWGAVTFVAYSFLMSVFRIKNSGYPFYLPPF